MQGERADGGTTGAVQALLPSLDQHTPVQLSPRSKDAWASRIEQLRFDLQVMTTAELRDVRAALSRVCRERGVCGGA